MTGSMTDFQVLLLLVCVFLIVAALVLGFTVSKIVSVLQDIADILRIATKK